MLLYDSVLFDLDGTLLDSLQALAESTNYALVSSTQLGRDPSVCWKWRSTADPSSCAGRDIGVLRRAVSGTVQTLLPRPYEL